MVYEGKTVTIRQAIIWPIQALLFLQRFELTQILCLIECIHNNLTDHLITAVYDVVGSR